MIRRKQIEQRRNGGDWEVCSLNLALDDRFGKSEAVLGLWGVLLERTKVGPAGFSGGSLTQGSTLFLFHFEVPTRPSL